jgi:hypothetical protein
VTGAEVGVGERVIDECVTRRRVWWGSPVFEVGAVVVDGGW